MRHPLRPPGVAWDLGRNLLLATLPAATQQQLRRMAQEVEFVPRDQLFEQGATLDAVFFPLSGWVSLLVNLNDGNAAEVGLVGREGMLGLPLLMGSDRSSLEGLVQGQGRFLRLPAAEFRHLLDHAPAFRNRLLLYYEAYFTQVRQTAACNGRHGIAQRLARWLLMTHDRAEVPEFPTTHDLLALMLGVRRAGVSAAAGQLRQRGLIHCERGRIRICSRAGLEKAACECHAAVRQEYQRLLFPPPANKAA